jgi:hypothetical protein
MHFYTIFCITNHKYETQDVSYNDSADDEITEIVIVDYRGEIISETMETYTLIQSKQRSQS